MVEVAEFKIWLKNNTTYSAAVIRDTASRIKRADNLLQVETDDIYQYRLEQIEEYKTLSTSVRSQIKKAVKLYQEYMKEINKNK